MNFSVVFTQGCNLLCDHCYLPSVPFTLDSPNNVSESLCERTIHALADQFADDVQEIYLTGGEYLLLPYGRSLVDKVRRSFPRSRIFAYTNGILFVEDRTLFDDVRPDVFHVGIDAWHGTVAPDGSSSVGDLFVGYLGSSRATKVILHWTRKEGDEPLFARFAARYANAPNTLIEDRSLNTTTGRAASLPLPAYRSDEVWRPCDIGDHLLAKYDGCCYGCHFGLPVARLGPMTSDVTSQRLACLRESPLSTVFRGPESESFYRYLCRKYAIEFTRNRCVLCEKFVFSGVDLPHEAHVYARGAP